jgi:hypothetical protein
VPFASVRMLGAVEPLLEEHSGMSVTRMDALGRL